jgi:hypothetical protein
MLNEGRISPPISGGQKELIQKTLPTQLDTHTRVSQMAALIFGLEGAETAEKAVLKAFEMDDLVYKELGRLKRYHADLRQQREGREQE